MLSLYYMTGWTDRTGATEIIIVSVVQGFGFGLVFVPLSTVAFLTLPNHLRTDGTSMLTLMRNVASSIGISLVIAQLTQGTRYTYAIMSEHINPFNHALQMPIVRDTINLATDQGGAMADAMVKVQSQITAFSHDYQLVMIFTACAIPLAVLDRLDQGDAAGAIGGARSCGDRVVALHHGRENAEAFRSISALSASLRAKRSNPLKSIRGEIDCFASLAMTWREVALPIPRDVASPASPANSATCRRATARRRSDGSQSAPRQGTGSTCTAPTIGPR